MKLEDILSQGFPDKRNELWKYTDLSLLSTKAFKLAGKAEDALAEKLVLKNIAQKNIFSENYLIFLNGCLIKSVLPYHIILKALNNDHKSENTLAANDIFEDLNYFYPHESYELIILSHPDMTAALDLKKLQILHLVQAQDYAWIQPRIKITAAEKTEIQIIESFLSETPSIVNAVTEIIVKPQARADYFKIQQEHAQTFHIGRTYIEIEKNAYAQTFTLSKGGQLARSDIHVRLNGQGAACDLYGLSDSRQRMCLDHHTLVEHLACETRSRQIYRGIINDSARTVFNGKIIVHPEAHKAEAEQASHHLLLSSNAEIDVKPELEIYHDDVKCTHGATIGQLDESALFYLESRGLNKETAQAMLINAFSRQIVDKIQDKSLREKLCLD